MKNYLLIFAVWLMSGLQIVGCGNHHSEQTYDEMLNDVVQNFNKGIIGGDSVLKNFVKKVKADSVARKYSNSAMKEEMMLNLISDYIDAGQVDNAQHLYDNMLKYAEQEYGKVSQMAAMAYKEKAHLYERVGDLDNAIQMMQKSAEVFEKLPKSSCNYYKDANDFIGMWTEEREIIKNHPIPKNLSLDSLERELCTYFDYESSPKAAGFWDYMEPYLLNPQTLTQQSSLLDSVMEIHITPDDKYKFYSYDRRESGTIGYYTTYIQYKDSDENISYKEWLANLRSDYSSLICNVWQFKYAGKDYYVIKTFKQGMNCSWGYGMEIVTLKEGVPTYHTQFYPKGIYTPHEYKYFTFDEDGNIIGDYYAPAYDVAVCSTDNCNHNINYTFDPKTLTVYVTDDASAPDNPIKQVRKHSWRLILRS